MPTLTYKQRIAAGFTLLLPFLSILFFDQPVLEWRRAVSSPLFSQLMKTVTLIGQTEILLVVCLLLYAFSRWRRSKKGVEVAYSTAVALILTGILTQILKHLIGRPRPGKFLRGIISLGPSLLHDSFPSGHSVSIFAFSALYAREYPHLKVPLYLLAFLVSFSRVYLGHHFLSDTLMGAIIGYFGSLLINSALLASKFRFWLFYLERKWLCDEGDAVL